MSEIYEIYAIKYAWRDAVARDHYIFTDHDPLVMSCYPAASPELEGIVARLDVAPLRSMVDASRGK